MTDMKTARDRFGFTLVETMVTASIAGFLLAFAVVPTYLYCQRMFQLAVSQTESTFAMRKIRDRLLFHIGPHLDSGLLTGAVTNDGASITVNWAKSNFTSDPDPNHPDSVHDNPDKIRLVWRTDENDSDVGFLFNEKMPHDTENIQWQTPSSMFIINTWAKTIDLPRMRICLVNKNFRAETWILLPDKRKEGL